jgi:hypothetical protein
MRNPSLGITVVKFTGFAENKGLNEPCGRSIVCREQNRKML